MTNEIATSSHNNHINIPWVNQLLESRRPLDVRLGIKTVFVWIKDDPENDEFYSLLENIGKHRSTYLPAIQDQAEELAKEGNKKAEKMLQNLSVFMLASPRSIEDEDLSQLSVSDLISKADDFYYAAEYDKAIFYYQKVVYLDKRNLHARDQIKKAELSKGQEQIIKNLPREVIQFYQRARSLLNAKDYGGAVSLLETAIRSAEQLGLSFPQAQKLLDSLEDARAVVDFMEKAHQALKDGDWETALRLFDYVISLDKDNADARNLSEQVNKLIHIKNMIVMLDNPQGDPQQLQGQILSIRSQIDDSKYTSYVYKLKDEVINLLRQSEKKISTLYKKQAEEAYKSANEQAYLMKAKCELYEKAIRLYEIAESINPGKVDQMQLTAKERYEILSKGILKIDTLKKNQKYPEGISLEDVREWEKFAPNDPEVKEAGRKVRQRLRINYAKVIVGITAVLSIISFMLSLFPVPVLFNPLIFLGIAAFFGAVALVLSILAFFWLDQDPR